MSLELMAIVVNVFILVCIGLLIVGSLHPSDRHLGLFSRLYAVPLTEATVEPLRATIRRMRLFRYVGAAIALLVAWVIDLQNIGLLLIGAGYALGAMAAEASRRPASDARRAASMKVRRAGDYVRPWFAKAVVGAGGLATLTAAVAAVDVGRLGFDSPAGGRLSGREMVLVAIGVLIVVAGPVLAAQLARRPQPLADVDTSAMHHAVRTVGVLSCCGGAMMTAGLVVLVTARTTSLHDIPGVSGGLAIIGLVTVCLGLKMVLSAIPRFAPFWERTTGVAAEVS